MVSDGVGAWDSSSIEKGLEYISDNPDVREVILSGGDPLILSNSRLRFVLDSLESIPHIKRIRIDTKAFTMMPQRITEDLASLLSNYQPFYLIGHFSHPYELVPETLDACKRLVNSGIPVLSHTPLLRGVNDEEETLVSLLQSLADNRIIPYYLIQFIPTKWTEHFRVSIERALELVRHIHDSCGGIATPTYIVYLPDAGGKVPVTPGYLVEKRSEGYLFETIDGRRVVYPEPTEESPSTSRYSTSDNGSP
jgi:lysine 2,3-aminomutase